MSRGVHRGRAVVVGCLVAAILASCSAAPSESLSAADCARPDANGVVLLTADNLNFDAPCISVAADTAFSVRLVNKDSSPHNVAIYDTPDKVNEYLRGAIIDRSDTIDYAVDPLPVGEYYFLCTVHPVMNGPLFIGLAD